MKPNKAERIIIGSILVVMFMIGIGGATAQAQGRFIHRPRPTIGYRPFLGPRWGWGSYWGWGAYGNPVVTVVNPIAQQREKGYSDGHKRGKDDARHNRPEAAESHSHYSKSDSLTYREAFLQGYTDGYADLMDKSQ